MSKIAQALNKATERTGHTTAPFLTGLPPTEPPGRESKEAELRKAKRRWGFWRVVAFIAFPITVFVLWMQFSDLWRQAAAPVGKSQTALEAGVAAKSAESALAQGPAAPAASAVPGVEEKAGPKSPEQMQAQVQALVFTALMPGTRPRIVHLGRVIGVGDKVDEDLVFAGMEEGMLVFKDEAGTLYRRRY